MSPSHHVLFTSDDSCAAREGDKAAASFKGREFTLLFITEDPL